MKSHTPAQLILSLSTTHSQHHPALVTFNIHIPPYLKNFLGAHQSPHITLSHTSFSCFTAHHTTSTPPNKHQTPNTPAFSPGVPPSASHTSQPSRATDTLSKGTVKQGPVTPQPEALMRPVPKCQMNVWRAFPYAERLFTVTTSVSLRSHYNSCGGRKLPLPGK